MQTHQGVQLLVWPSDTGDLDSSKIASGVGSRATRANVSVAVMDRTPKTLQRGHPYSALRYKTASPELQGDRRSSKQMIVRVSRNALTLAELPRSPQVREANRSPYMGCDSSRGERRGRRRRRDSAGNARGVCDWRPWLHRYSSCSRARFARPPGPCLRSRRRRGRRLCSV